MRIALLHALETPSAEPHPDAIAATVVEKLASALRRAGHIATPIDVLRPLSDLVALLRDQRPDLTLVFAGASRGEHRAALYVAILDELGLEHLGTRDATIAAILGAAASKAAKGATLSDLSRPALERALRAVTAEAAERLGLDPDRATPVPRAKERIALVFNLKRERPSADADAEAEFDSLETVNALADAIRSHGYDVELLEAGPELPQRLDPRAVDVVFNIAEGYRGRGREALVPALLDLYGIEYTGSDAATLAVTLDKGLAKRVVHAAGVPVAPFVLMRTGEERLPPELTFPLIVKPVAEGSSKGVHGSSVVHDRDALKREVASVVGRYRHDALVEAFLPGREFTIGVLGNRRPRVLPPMEVVFTDPSVTVVYGFEQKQSSLGVRFEVPANVDAALGRELVRVARRSFEALGCRDVARIDVRLSATGRPCFIECNPLPGLTPGWSDLCVIGEASGLDYRTLVGEILRPAVRRRREATRGGR
ncbi:MAG: hypothetical protein H6700_06095 [Myxococcales bacterium]|nr:hypothetical protein [Myxococcales bacterium]MCB9531317.1 hypothetical protein [Myxococcales bacterium]